MKKDLENILSGYQKVSETESSKKLIRKINKLEKTIAKKEKEFNKRAKQEIKRGAFFADKRKRNSFFGKIRTKWINYRNLHSVYHWNIISELEEALGNINYIIKSYVKTRYKEQIDRSREKHRKELMSLQNALKARRGSGREAIFNKLDLGVILKTFPVWLVKMSDIYQVLPMQTELFDLAIIDEATQCDIASTIPIMQRAKHVILTGDPKQLRHVSFLSQTQQKIFIDKFNLQDTNPQLLDYRNNSILDVFNQSISEQSQISMLNEHYRSEPAIIRFSNNHFYNNSLRIMTSRPEQTNNEGIILKQTKGIRTKSGYNKIETDYILKKISEIITEENALNSSEIQTIGILSPFKDQSDYISRRIKNELSVNDLVKHKISVGTAYSFQGEERDIMFLSIALDHNSHFMAFRHLEKPDVFNVSITRARSLQYIVHSLNTEKLKADSLIRKYLESFNSDSSYGLKQNAYKDEFTVEVRKALEKSQFKIKTGFPVAGYFLDMIAAKNNKLIAIDLIGYPGQFNDIFTLERYKMLKRAGLKVFPLPYSVWVLDRGLCLEEIDDFLV